MIEAVQAPIPDESRWMASKQVDKGSLLWGWRGMQPHWPGLRRESEQPQGLIPAWKGFLHRPRRRWCGSSAGWLAVDMADGFSMQSSSVLLALPEVLRKTSTQVSWGASLACSGAAF